MIIIILYIFNQEKIMIIIKFYFLLLTNLIILKIFPIINFMNKLKLSKLKII